MAGASSGDNMMRMIWRIESVEVTRAMPRRWATYWASAVLPTPAAPASSRIIGRSEAWMARQVR